MLDDKLTGYKFQSICDKDIYSNKDDNTTSPMGEYPR